MDEKRQANKRKPAARNKLQSKVVYLPGCRPVAEEENIPAKVLRVLLARAERGELTELAFVGRFEKGWRAGTVNILNRSDALEACGMLKGLLMGDTTHEDSHL